MSPRPITATARSRARTTIHGNRLRPARRPDLRHQPRRPRTDVGACPRSGSQGAAEGRRARRHSRGDPGPLPAPRVFRHPLLPPPGVHLPSPHPSSFAARTPEIVTTRLTSILCLLAIAAAAGVGAAPAEPEWLRYPSISPDGKTIVFTYKGDLYRVPAAGDYGRAPDAARSPRLHANLEHDGKWVAFASDRVGHFDVFVTAAEGGEVRRGGVRSQPVSLRLAAATTSGILFGAWRGSREPAVPDRHPSLNSTGCRCPADESSRCRRRRPRT